MLRIAKVDAPPHTDPASRKTPDRTDQEDDAEAGLASDDATGPVIPGARPR